MLVVHKVISHYKQNEANHTASALQPFNLYAEFIAEGDLYLYERTKSLSNLKASLQALKHQTHIPWGEHMA